MIIEVYNPQPPTGETFDPDTEWLLNQISRKKILWSKISGSGYSYIPDYSVYVDIPEGYFVGWTPIMVLNVDGDGIHIGLCYPYLSGTDKYYRCPSGAPLATDIGLPIIAIDQNKRFIGMLMQYQDGKWVIIKSMYNPWYYIEFEEQVSWRGKTFKSLFIVPDISTMALVIIALIVGGLVTFGILHYVSWISASEAQRAYYESQSTKVRLLSEMVEASAELCRQNPDNCEDLKDVITYAMDALNAQHTEPPSEPPNPWETIVNNWDKILPIVSIVGLMLLMLKFNIIQKIVDWFSERR